jgi:hypothetical protein
MDRHFGDAEERRRISMALSVRQETRARFAELRRGVWSTLVKVLHIPAGRKIARDRSRLAR